MTTKTDEPLPDWWQLVKRKTFEAERVVPKSRATISPSELWMCMRRLELRILGKETPEEYPILPFLIGKASEEAFGELLKRAGLYVTSLVRSGDWESGISGESDYIIRDTNGENAIVEVKTVDFLLKSKIPFPSHIDQITCYQWLFGINRGYIVYLVKGGFIKEPVIFKQDYDSERMQILYNKALTIRSRLDKREITPFQLNEQCIKCPERNGFCIEYGNKIEKLERDIEKEKRKKRKGNKE